MMVPNFVELIPAVYWRIKYVWDFFVDLTHHRVFDCFFIAAALFAKYSRKKLELYTFPGNIGDYML